MVADRGAAEVAQTARSMRRSGVERRVSQMGWSRWATVLAVGAGLAFAGCGGDDEGAKSGSGASETAGPKEQLVSPPPTTPTTDIGVSEPLKKKPPKKSVIWLQCELPVCDRYGKGYEEAAATLGWNLKTIVYTATGPGQAMGQAVAQRPDYIAISGIPSALMKPQLAAAEKAGIPVFGAGTVEKPPDSPFELMVGGTLQPDAEHIAHWVINDSGGKANVVGVSIPQFPVLNTETDWLKKEFKGLCADCSYDDLEITVDDIGAGAVGKKVVGYLQAHPDVNYAFFTFSDAANGVSQTLRQAGLADKVKIVGVAGNANNFKNVFAGTEAAWTTAGVEWDAWVHLDGMARLANGQEISQAQIDAVYPRPEWVVTDSPEAKQAIEGVGGEWNGPANFKESFKKLWKVA
jgi:ribose transport system substrate-binding protein